MKTNFKVRKLAVPVSFGIEIEANAITLADKVGTYEGFFYITTDTSLVRPHDVEVVSQPLPAQMLIKQLQKLARKHVLACTHNAGIHVHITRTKTTLQRGREIQQFFLETSFLFRAFFGRSPNKFCALSSNEGSRYRLVNLTRNDTVEIRGFSNTIGNVPGLSVPWAITCLKRTEALFNAKQVDQDTILSILRRYPMSWNP